jgi:hypothetical protein
MMFQNSIQIMIGQLRHPIVMFVVVVVVVVVVVDDCLHHPMPLNPKVG